MAWDSDWRRQLPLRRLSAALDLSGGIAFWWGCAGGAVGWTAAFPLPIVTRLSLGRRAPKFGASRIVGFLGGLILYVLFGGVAAFIGSATSTKEALVLGAGGVAIVGRLLNGDGANQIAKPSS